MEPEARMERAPIPEARMERAPIPEARMERAPILIHFHLITRIALR